MLSFANQNGITGNYVPSSGTLFLTGSASVAAYQAALRSVAYSNPSTALPSGPRTITFRVNDGSLNSNIATRGLTYTAVNSAPTVATSGGFAFVNEGSSGAAIDSALNVNDSDDVNLAGATVAISSGLTAGDHSCSRTRTASPAPTRRAPAS